MTKDQKKVSLQRYAELLKQRLNSKVPEKHEHRAEVFKAMLTLDLKRTLAKIYTL